MTNTTAVPLEGASPAAFLAFADAERITVLDDGTARLSAELPEATVAELWAAVLRRAARLRILDAADGSGLPRRTDDQLNADAFLSLVEEWDAVAVTGRSAAGADPRLRGPDGAAPSLAEVHSRRQLHRPRP